MVSITRVQLESPFSGDLDRNMRYARRAMRDSLDRWEAPFLSHLLYTQVLDDNDPSDREQGIACGWAWLMQCDYAVFYLDYGMSSGMQRSLDLCNELNIHTVFRYIGKNEQEAHVTHGTHHTH
jgi:hypothetical protein